MTFLREKAAARDHVSLHAGRAACVRVSAHPGARRKHPLEPRPGPRAADLRDAARTSDALDGAIDIWCAGPKGFRRSIASRRSARAGGSTGSTTADGPQAARSRSMRPRPMRARPIWAAFKHDVPVYFYWHAVHWRHNSQKQGEPRPERLGRTASRSTTGVSRTSRSTIRGTSTATAC